MRKILSLLFVLFFCLNVFSQKKYFERGEASFYANKFNGRKTANGEVFRQNKLTAAHRTLAFGTILKVTNLTNGKYIIVRVNDRGPFSRGRIIDLSMMGAKKLDFVKKGHVRVSIESLSEKPKIKKNEKNNRKSRRQKRISRRKKRNVKSNTRAPKMYSSKQNVYGVQVGSYTDYSNAKDFLSSVKRKTSKPVYITSVVKNRRKYYKIVVGKCRSDREARKIQKSLRRKFRSCFVLKY